MAPEPMNENDDGNHRPTILLGGMIGGVIIIAIYLGVIWLLG